MRRKLWTKQEDDYLIANYTDNLTSKLAKHLVRSIRSVYARANLFNLKKSEEFRKSLESGVFTKGVRRSPGTEFKKGQQPFNKGKKQIEFMSAESIEKSVATRFKKGNRPHNAREIGSVKPHATGYLWLKTAECQKKEYHRIVWEKHHGEIPDGHNIVFKDGNPLNCEISNLECISNAELLERNSVHRYPPEIKRTMRNLQKLNKQIKKHEKKTNQH